MIVSLIIKPKYSVGCASSFKIAEYIRGKKSDNLVIGVPIMPFSFGGYLLNESARIALQEMKKNCDGVIGK